MDKYRITNLALQYQPKGRQVEDIKNKNAPNFKKWILKANLIFIMMVMMTTKPVKIIVLKWNHVVMMKRKVSILILKKTNPRYKRVLSELHAIKSKYT